MFSLYDIFESTEYTGEIDYHPSSSSDVFSDKMTLKEVKIRTSTATFKWEVGTEASAEWSINPFFSNKISAKVSGKIGKDTASTETIQYETAKEFACTPGRLCQIVSFSFTAEYTGNYYKMPVAHFSEQFVQSDMKWGDREIRKSSKVALASLAGKSEKWDLLGRSFYNLRTNETNAQMTQKSIYHADVEFPPKSIDIEPGSKSEGGGPGDAEIPIVQYENPTKLYRADLMIIFSLKKDKNPAKNSKRQSDLEELKLRVK